MVIACYSVITILFYYVRRFLYFLRQINDCITIEKYVPLCYFFTYFPKCNLVCGIVYTWLYKNILLSDNRYWEIGKKYPFHALWVDCTEYSTNPIVLFLQFLHLFLYLFLYICSCSFTMSNSLIRWCWLQQVLVNSLRSNWIK